MKYFDNRGALTLTKKKLIILLGAVLGVALITWSILMVSIFRKGKEGREGGKVPDGYKEIYLLTKETHLTPDGEVESCYSYEYDGNGNKIREVYECFRDGEKDYWQTKEYEYDSAGLVTKETITGKDTNSTQYEYTYDQKGNMIRETSTSENGRILSEWTYSDDGLLLKYTSDWYDYMKRHISYDKDIYEYDDTGRLIKEQNYRCDELIKTVTYPEPGKRMTYKYRYDEGSEDAPPEYLELEEWLDENENVLKELKYTSSGKLTDSGEYEYTEQSLKAETYARKVSKDKNGETTYETNREFYVGYDDTVLISKEIRKDYKTGEESGYYYTFDKNGNPVARTDYDSDGTSFISNKREYKRFVVPATQRLQPQNDINR